jgi:transposase
MEHAVEVVNGGGRRVRSRQNRHWSAEEKARIVAETLEPGATVNRVAQRHGLQAHHLSSWRTLARKGKLVLPAAQRGSHFTPVVVAETVASQPEAARADINIVFGPVTIRLDGKAAAARIAAIVHALNAAP